nr:unnamed protein product [Haemonchus contortus]
MTYVVSCGSAGGVSGVGSRGGVGVCLTGYTGGGDCRGGGVGSFGGGVGETGGGDGGFGEIDRDSELKDGDRDASVLTMDGNLAVGGVFKGGGVVGGDETVTGVGVSFSLAGVAKCFVGMVSSCEDAVIT